MSSGITEKRNDILAQLAECQVSTVNQLAIFHQRSPQVIRRDIRALRNKGLICSQKMGYGHGRGRPEEIIFLTTSGIEMLGHAGIILTEEASIDKEQLSPVFFHHHLLVNWFHIHLMHMERILPPLSANFLSSHSRVAKSKNGISLKERVALGNRSKGAIEFIPDGAFSLTYQDKDPNRTLLFFLEVDMDTETLASKNRNSKDIRQKIINYQALFRRHQYKRYERIFSAKLNGFRLLFLTNTFARMASICRLVQEIPPSDFIWVTEQERMVSRGLSAKIWARGGKINNPLQSILGAKLALESPFPKTFK